MAIMTLKIDERTKFGKYFYNLIQLTIRNNEEISIINEPNNVTKKAIREIETGKAHKVKNSEQLFKELGI